MTRPRSHEEGQVVSDRAEQIREPSLFLVLLHNDDYTTMDFVIMILETVFHKDTMEATQIMLNVHNHGLGVASILPLEIAETKVAMVHDLARQYEFPLRCSLEKA